MPRQKQRSVWRRPRDEQPGSGRGLTPRAVRRENTRVHRVCNNAFERFLERHVQAMEEDLRASAIKRGSSSAASPRR